MIRTQSNLDSELRGLREIFLRRVHDGEFDRYDIDVNPLPGVQMHRISHVFRRISGHRMTPSNGKLLHGNLTKLCGPISRRELPILRQFGRQRDCCHGSAILVLVGESLRVTQPSTRNEVKNPKDFFFYVMSAKCSQASWYTMR